MIIARFFVQDKFGEIRFFEETFFFADTSMDVVLKIDFFVENNVDII